ncbi:hypothetical protein C1I36_12550 [Dehalobacter sp. 14DCB1]|nr:hypothetical protein C1I36_12550 [Dehalobacter sp. 14DCB1]
MVGLVPDAIISVDYQFCVVIIKNVFDVFGTLVAILVNGIKVYDFLLGCLQVRGRAQEFIDKRRRMKKRKTFVLRFSVVPC